MAAEPVDPGRLPPAAKKKIDFQRDIFPILETSCVRCHRPVNPMGGYRLDNRADALSGGDTGNNILPGQSARSPLIHFVAHLVPDMEMPPPGKGDPLTAEQIGLLQAWIDQGLVWPERADPPPSFSVAPTLRWVTVSGDSGKFSELFWRQPGWSGGLDDVDIRTRQGDVESIFKSRFLAPEEDFSAFFSLRRFDLGFVQTGVEHFRRYYDHSGGYFPAFNPPLLQLADQPHLDYQRVWLDVGLTLPQWPRVVVGYEYQLREGAKSTLQWGPAGTISPFDQFTDARNIFPASKQIDEQVHIVKLELEHEVAGVLVADQFRGEFYDLKTRRENVTFYDLTDPANSSSVTVRERSTYFHGANTLRLEKRFADWLFASGGYLYSHLDGEASFRLDGMQSAPFVEQWRGVAPTLEQESHVFNLNTLFGPWQHLTLSLGAQSDWTRQRGFGMAELSFISPFFFSEDTQFESDIDRASVEEMAVLRYTGLPFTVLFAEGRLRQESIGQFEEQLGSHHEFLRDTDASGELIDYRLGFNSAPWRPVTLYGHYRRRDSDWHYDHLRDWIPAGPGVPVLVPGSGLPLENFGYSAFIRSSEITTDEVEARLSLRPNNWLKTSLTYQWTHTDFNSATDPIPGVSPGGDIAAARTRAHIYSLNTIFTLLRNFYLSTTFSYQDNRTTSARNNNPSVVPYRGDIYSLLVAANYHLNARTDLFSSYSFSHADFGQNNFADGLPLGITYDLHNMQAGVSRRLSKNLTSRLQYGFFRYGEPTSGGFNDFTAHAVLATLSLRLP